MAAYRGLPVVEASECSSSGHSAPFCVPDVNILGSPGQSSLDLLANLPDPPNPPDLSDHGSSHRGPTSPRQLASEGDDELMALSDTDQGPSVLRKRGTHDNHDDDDIVASAADGDDALPSRQDKGKAPDTACLLFASERGPDTESYQEALANLQQAPNPTKPLMEDERLSNLIETATNADDSESSSRATQSGTEDASYPSSVFEEPQQDHNPAATASASDDQVRSWEQKQKQKIDPEAETGSFSDASGEEKPFQPLQLGDPGWETSAGRPPQKLPIRFRDAVGRNFLFPWEKAKTWAGMKGLVQSCFIHVDVIGPHVMAGRYDLSINLPFSMDAASEILSPGTPLSPGPSQATTSAAETPSSSAAAGSSSTPGPSNGANSSQSQPQPKSSFVVLPELWEDTVEPGMIVVQHMWPFQTPSYIAQPGQPTPAQPHYHGPPPPPARGRGAARGRGRGAAVFGGRGGAGPNVFGTHTPHHAPLPGSRTPIIIVNDPPLRGKTRKRQDR